MKTQHNTTTEEFTITLTRDEVRLLVTEILCARSAEGLSLVLCVKAANELTHSRRQYVEPVLKEFKSRTGPDKTDYPMDLLLKIAGQFLIDTNPKNQQSASDISLPI